MVVIAKNLEDARRRFIEKGGSVNEVEEITEWTNVSLRITCEMLKSIDDTIAKGKIGISRNAWILQALKDKLDKKEKEK